MKTAQFHEKIKMPKFGTKNACLGIFGLEFENNIIIFEISTMEFVLLGNFLKKTTKMLKFWTKNTLFGYF